MAPQIIRFGSVSFGILIALTFGSGHLIAQKAPLPESFAPDRVLVAFYPGTTASEMQAVHSQAGGKVIKTIDPLGVQVVSVRSGTVLQSVQQYRANPKVRFVEPNYRRPLFPPVTNEGSEPTIGILNNYNEQWGLHNTGQSFGVTADPIFGTISAPAYTGFADADIDAEEGWNLTHGSSATKIAILDSGVSCSHVDLDGKCVEQVNFVAEDGSPVDDIIGHGTHVAGIAAAETDNGVGIAGVAWEPSIGSMKVCSEDYSLALFGIVLGICEDEDIIEGIVYAADAGYDVINMSLAGAEMSVALRDAVDYAWNKGVVLVAGAGNDYNTERRYPAAYDNVIAVAGTDYFDNLAYFSSFSSDSDDWVSVAAPAHVIFSTLPGEQCGLSPADPVGCYGWNSGTSMATPFVSGIAALLRSYLPNPTNVQIRAAIENGADATGALGQNLLAWTKFGRVNLFKALTYDPSNPGTGGGDTTPPLISGVMSARVAGPRFQVSWITDEPATSVLILSCCGQVSDNNLVTEHNVIFKGRMNTTYEYYVRSTDAAGNQATAGPFYHEN
jgi:thermitase